MKKLLNLKHEKEFDTQTLLTDLSELSVSDTKETVDRKTLANSETEIAEGKKTQIYEPKPLTPDDDIYDDIVEHFAYAPTKPKYWFEEFGDYWSCSCGHINKGERCKSCGLERELLRSLFILHKPDYADSKLDKKIKRSQKQVDKEEELQQEKDAKRKEREASGEDLTRVVPIEMDDDEPKPVDSDEADTSVAGTVDSDIVESRSDASSDPDSSMQKAITAPVTEQPSKNPPAKIKYKEINVTDVAGAAKPNRKKRNIIIIAAITVCLILVSICGYAIYKHMAAPAMKYEEALELQASGKYRQAIEIFDSLGDYKDSVTLIWDCYVAIADGYFEEGSYSKAIEAYQIAMEYESEAGIKTNKDLNENIRSCYVAIGDRQYDNGEYEKAMATYTIAMEMKTTEDVQEKIYAAKLAYVQTYQADRTDQVEQYMAELMEISYPGIQEIYDEYYAWHIKIIANTSETDYSTDIDTASRKDTVYFHALVSGGEPGGTIDLYYDVTWPTGQSQIYNLDTHWQNGSKITARFQYPIPLFGKEGKLTFTLYDKNTNEVMGSDAVTFQH